MALVCVPCKGTVVPSVANPIRLTLAPAGSTWGGPGGNKWAEALQEKASIVRSADSAGRNVSEHWAGLETSLQKPTRHNNGEDRGS